MAHSKRTCVCLQHFINLPLAKSEKAGCLCQIVYLLCFVLRTYRAGDGRVHIRYAQADANICARKQDAHT